MATSRREPPSNARANKSLRNASLGIRPSEPDQGLRRARSVPTSPDRRLSPSLASSSSNACRPSSSFSARTTSTQSASSSTHGKPLHSAATTAGAKQANTVRRKADKPGPKSVWPPALATPSNTSQKDTARAANLPSNVQRSKLSTASSLKLRSEKATPGAGKTQAVSSSRAPGTLARKRMVAENSASIQRTRSVPARQKGTRKTEETEVELLMGFDEMENLSTNSIEEHLHERLPDPIELKPVDVITSEDAHSELSSNKEEYKNEEVTEHNSEETHEGKDNEDINRNGNADAGINSQENIMKEATIEDEVREAGNEIELDEAVSETGLKEAVDETKSKEASTEIELEEAAGKTMLQEAVNETVLTDAVSESELIKREEHNDVTEGGRSKPKLERKNKVMALVGKFETVMSK